MNNKVNLWIYTYTI